MNGASTLSRSGDDDLVWYFAYATYLDENTFRRSIGSPNYRESATVVADDAWLSFDYCGIPFVQPAYASLIVRGKNDGPFSTSAEKAPAVSSVEYLRYLHPRCYPGLPYEPPGELPPHVEGIAYLITRAQLRLLKSTGAWDTVTVTCQRFKEGDLSQRLGDPFNATALVAKEQYRSSHLMPSVRVFGPIYRGALTRCLSTTYLRYLVLLRPYNIAHGSKGTQRAATVFMFLILLPQFLFLYAPLTLVQRYVLGRFMWKQMEHAKLAVGDWIRWTAMTAERWLFRPILGNAAWAIGAE